MNDNNPLLMYSRKPEFTVKLPSNGNWYPEGMIDYTPNGEIEIFSMLPKDELLLMNPDALLSGKANIDLIKSCVPSIHNPENLLFPDANVLLLAIQKATYGNTLTVEYICPNCVEKASKLEESIRKKYANKNEISDESDVNDDIESEIEEKVKYEISNGEKNNEFIIHKQEVEFDIDYLLQNISYLDEEYIVSLDNGLKVYLQPNTISDKLNYGLISFNYQKVIKMYGNYDFEKAVTDEKLKNDMSTVVEYYDKMNNLGSEIITSCIQKIKLPDETFISNREYILEFISNSKSSVVSVINKKIKEINDIGLPSRLTYECSCCGHKWEDKFYGFNQVDFFGIGS